MCLGKEAKMDNPQVCCLCRLAALSREHVPRSRGRKGRGVASLPSKRILLHTGPEATQPQTRTCTHQTRTRPLHRAKLPGPGTEPCWRWHHPVCTHSGTPVLAVEGQKGLGTELCPLPRGRGIPGPQYFLLLTLRSSRGGTAAGQPPLLPLPGWESRRCCFQALLEPL